MTGGPPRRKQLAYIVEQEAAERQARESFEAAGHEQTAQIQALREQLTGVQQLAVESAAKTDALARGEQLHQEMAQLRSDATTQLDAAREEHRQRVSEFQETMAARDTAFRTAHAVQSSGA